MLRSRGISLVALLLWICWVRLTEEEPVVCESAGQCIVTSGCVADSSGQCKTPQGQKVYASFEPNSNRSNLITPSRSDLCKGNFNNTDMVLESDLVLTYRATSATEVSVCVSWTLTQSSGQTGGFQVQLLDRTESEKYRYCISDSTQRKMCFNYVDYKMFKRQ